MIITHRQFITIGYQLFSLLCLVKGTGVMIWVLVRKPIMLDMQCWAAQSLGVFWNNPSYFCEPNSSELRLTSEINIHSRHTTNPQRPTSVYVYNIQKFPPKFPAGEQVVKHMLGAIQTQPTQVNKQKEWQGPHAEWGRWTQTPLANQEAIFNWYLLAKKNN